MPRFSNLNGIRRVLKILIQNQEKEQDSVILIAGKEGEGKSNLELFCIDLVDEIRGTNTSIKNVTMDLKEFCNRWRDIGKGDVLAMDEGDELDGENWMEARVKRFKRCMKKTRMESNIYFILTTNPLKINRYLREDRLTAVFYVSKWYKIRVFHQGLFIKILRDARRKGVSSIDFLRKYPHSTLEDYYKKAYKGKLWKAYRVKKKLASKNAREDIVDEEDLPVFKRKYLVLSQAHAYLGMNITPFYKALARGLFKDYNVDGKRMFKREELDKAKPQICKLFKTRS